MDASKLRFSIAHLFYAVFLVAASTALFGLLGLPIAVFVLLVWIQLLVGVCRESELMPQQLGDVQQTSPHRAVVGGRMSSLCRAAHSCGVTRRGGTKLELLVVAILVAMLIGLLVPAVNDSDPMRHAETSMNLVVKALQAYEQQHGRFPPPVVFSEDGTALHSWRALILKQLGEEELAAAYDLDKPWNSPQNLVLARRLPWHYQSYYPQTEEHAEPAVRRRDGHGRAGLGQTSLHLLDAGPCADTACPALVEHEARTCNWLEPTPAIGVVDLEQPAELDSGFWQHGFFVSTHRGRLVATPQGAQGIHPATAARQVAGLSRGNFGREIVAGQGPQALRRYHFGNMLRLAIFLLAALYPFRWLNALRRQTVDSSSACECEL